jgi:hypothetical protein
MLRIPIDPRREPIGAVSRRADQAAVTWDAVCRACIQSAVASALLAAVKIADASVPQDLRPRRNIGCVSGRGRVAMMCNADD